jgi:hypothetical protein
MLDKIKFEFNGTPAKASWEEVPPEIMPINKRLNSVVWAIWESTSDPTNTQKTNLKIIQEEIPEIQAMLKNIKEELDKIQLQLVEMKAPYIPGVLPKF